MAKVTITTRPEPAPPTFERGQLVINRHARIILCEKDRGKAGFAGTVVAYLASQHGAVGHYNNDWSKDGYEVFKGSVTLTEE